MSSSFDIEWRSRLHCPTRIQDLRQPKFEQALRIACQVILPSLTQPESSSASVILLGPTSSGKSLLTHFIIDTVAPEVASSGGQLVVIQLNGLIHSTPTQAWCHMSQTLLGWHRSVCYGMSSDGSTKYDVDRNDIALNNDDNPAVVSQLQDAVLPALNHIRQTKGAIILVLDHLHRFISSDPLSQTVLYSVLNFLQDRSLRAACIAQTTIFDITDLLEKRVSSRFSHRKIILPLIDSYDEISEFLHSALSSNLKPPSVSPVVRGQPGRHESGRRKNSSGTVACSTGQDAVNEFSRILLADQRFQRSVERYLNRSRVVAPILWALDAALSFTLPHINGQLNISTAVSKAIEVVTDSLETRDSTEDSLMSLTNLQLQLLAALCKVEYARASETAKRKRDGDVSGTKHARVLFTNVYEEYLGIGKMDEGCLAERDVSQNLVDRQVAEHAWELLVEGGLIIRTGTGSKDSRPVVCSVGKSRVDAAVENHPGSTTVMKNWAKRNIVR